MQPVTHPGVSGARRFAWMIRPDLAYGTQHGGNLRLFNLGQALLADGHAVHLIVRTRADEDHAARRAGLEDLVRRRVVSGYQEIAYGVPRWRGRLARARLHPALIDRALRTDRARATRAILSALQAWRADVCIVSDRAWLFALDDVRRQAVTIADWCDSLTLSAGRALRQALRSCDWRSVPGLVRELADAMAEEAYYPRLADVSLAVSPVDARALRRLSGARRHELLPNGIAVPPRRPVERLPDRLVFSGNMSFAPNWQSAIWFIDHVMPVLRRRRPGVTFVVAGVDPVPSLRARAGADVLVTGFVPDIQAEIARGALYVAPLVTGGGFKNKVVEALAAGTFVVGTSLAVEFLPPAMRELIPTADTPGELADAILAYLGAPHAFEARRQQLEDAVRTQFSWTERARDLVAIAASVPWVAGAAACG